MILNISYKLENLVIERVCDLWALALEELKSKVRW